MSQPAFRIVIFMAVIAVVAIASSGATYWLTRDDSATAASAPTAGTDQQREVLYWYDPMVPDQHFDQPGQSPFMDMELVPKYADEAGSGDAAVQINPGVLQNLGVRTASVARTDLTTSVDAAANVQYNDRDVAIVQTRSAGFVEHTYDLAPGDIIEQGAPLTDLLVPAWGGAQEEFLAVLNTGDPALIDATRTRLMLTGMPAALIAHVERTRRTRPVITVDAPVGGAIKSLEVRPGMTLQAGATLATLNGLETIWLEAAVPEAQSEQVRVGQSVTAHFTAYPGETFDGQVITILPENDPTSRTLQVRVELPNPDLRLRPGMFARVQLESTRENVLTVPSEAVLHSDQRDYVLIANGDGGFTPAVVTPGQQSGQQTVILEGLQAGQNVVTSGQFLIDSEASLQGALDRLGSPDDNAGSMTGRHMDAEGSTRATATTAPIEGRGRIEAISKDEITLSHEPIPALDWPAMTMGFELADPASAEGLDVGDTVIFTVRESDTGYTVADVQQSTAQQSGGAQ